MIFFSEKHCEISCCSVFFELFFGKIGKKCLPFSRQSKEYVGFSLPTCTYQGSKVGISKVSMISVPEDCFILANSVDRDDMPHSLQSKKYVGFFLYQHCTYQGVKVSSISVPEDCFILANSEDPDDMPHSNSEDSDDKPHSYSVDPDDMPQSVACHLSLHCLQKIPFKGLQCTRVL